MTGTAFHDAEALDFAALMPQVATRLLGEPNQRLSRGPRLRFGNHGSMEIDVDKGVFNDHEAGVNGGVLDLIRHKQKCDVAGAFRWLEEQRLKERSDRSAPVAQPTKRQIFYDYRDARGAVAYRVERRGKSAVPPFLQHGPDGNGGFHSARGCMQGVARLPYRLPELLAAPRDAIVFVVEGEKDADRLAGEGLIATTNSGGAGKFGSELVRYFSGRRVVVLPDNDEPGEAHARDIAEKLTGTASAVAIVRLPGLAPKGDVSDWFAAGGTAAELVETFAKPALEQPATAPETLPLIDIAQWIEADPEPRRFAVERFMPVGEVTLFTGPGGVGKSQFAQQLATCYSVGAPILGLATAGGTALYVTAEDDDRELHWRQAHICRATGIAMTDLAGRMFPITLRGRLNNELATFDHEGRVSASPTFSLLRATIERTKASLVILDNVAHMFAGNENDRGQVTAFANLLALLCRDHGCSVVLIGHPNKVGDDYSGSTAWLNAVRSQITLKRPEGEQVDPDERVLTLGKANYARGGEQVKFRWHDFAFIRDDDLPEDDRIRLRATAVAGAENDRFLQLLDKAREERRAVSASRAARNYAPRVFERMTSARGMSASAFEGAMERLLHLNLIVAEGRVYQRENRAWVTGIVRSEGAPTPAPTMHQPGAQTRTNQHHQPAPSTHLPLKGETGAAPGAAPPGDWAEYGPSLDDLNWEPIE